MNPAEALHTSVSALTASIQRVSESAPDVVNQVHDRIQLGSFDSPEFEQVKHLIDAYHEMDKKYEILKRKLQKIEDLTHSRHA